MATALLVFAALATVLLMDGPFAAGSDTATVRIGSAHVASGDSETVPLEALNVPAPGLCAVTVDIIYDQAVKTTTVCNEDPEDKLGLAECGISTAGTISFAATKAEGGVTGNITLANITFQAVGDPGDVTTLDVVVREFTDCEGNSIAVNDEDATNRIRLPDGGYGTLYIDALPDIDNNATGIGAVDVCRDSDDGDGPLDIGDTFIIDIVITGAPDIRGALHEFNYDPAVLNVTAYDWQSWKLGTGFGISDPMPDTDGHFNTNWTGSNTVSGDGVIQRITLRAIGNGESDVRFSYQEGFEGTPQVTDSAGTPHFPPEVLVDDPDGDMRVVVGGCCPVGDSDGDTIPNDVDQCCQEAEDADGCCDQDGCPETDCDGDGINDQMDDCCEQAEDADGCCDQDGCPETDCDKDLMPDAYEVDNICLNPADDDADGDKDSDDLTNIEEMNLGTDPCEPDTDGDSLGHGPPGGFFQDGVETLVGTDPLDDCADSETPNDERGPDHGQPLSPWPPDFNDNGVVTVADLVLFRQHYPPLGGRPDLRHDLNADGQCDIGDLVVLKNYWTGSGYDTCTVG